jgi:hypothetical protein
MFNRASAAQRDKLQAERIAANRSASLSRGKLSAVRSKTAEFEPVAVAGPAAALAFQKEYLANGTFRTVSKSSPTPSYLSSTTEFCRVIPSHHRKPELELGDFRVSSKKYVPEHKRIDETMKEHKRGLLGPDAGEYVDPALPASAAYDAFRPRNKSRELAGPMK